MAGCEVVLCNDLSLTNAQGLSVDNTRLKQSEKKLLKENIKLNRNVKVSLHLVWDVESCTGAYLYLSFSSLVFGAREGSSGGQVED